MSSRLALVEGRPGVIESVIAAQDCAMCVSCLSLLGLVV